MPRVADYSIIADNWVVEAVQNSVKFNVPETIDLKSQCILGFMIQASHTDDMTLTVRINGTQVWKWSYTGGHKHTQFFQEVIAGGIVKSGENTFSFQTSVDDHAFVQLSDIVLWWQANI
jgi:hypothetical protein